MTEPENLVLQQLREIRATLDARLGYLEQAVSEIVTRLTGIERILITLYGKVTEGEQRLTQLEARVERLEKLTE